MIPNEHVENMLSLSKSLAGEVHESARQIALAMKSAYGCQGISTRQHNEPAGYQDVWHYHLHVFSRGSNRQAIFLNEGDYAEFDMLLASAIGSHRLDCFGWSLMPNHWHGILRCPPEGLSRFMQQLNHRYALRFDRRWGRRAHVFASRFGAVLQETEEQFLWTLRYVARNPVEAGICSSPFDACWTSFHATAGLVRAPAHLRVRDILAYFGNEPDDARRRYVDFVVDSRDSATAGGTSIDSALIA